MPRSIKNDSKNPAHGGAKHATDDQAGPREQSLSSIVVEKPKRSAFALHLGREKMKKLLTIFAISGSLLLVSACNTVEGAGRDIESVGDCADGVPGNC